MMLDIALIKDKDLLKKELSKKGYDVRKIDLLDEVYADLKRVKSELEILRAKKNQILGLSDEAKILKSNIAELEKSFSKLETEYNLLMIDIPNLPDIDAPVGKDETENVVIYEAKDFYKCQVQNPLPHWDVGAKLGIIDIETASKISGSMFAMYKGKGAKLLRALVNYCLSIHECKYLEVIPPHMVTSQSLTYTGHLPKFGDDQFKCSQDDLYLIPTAEVPLTASFANTAFKGEELPKRVMGYSVSFRREAGSAGKDTRGLQRLHEFHKVELLKIARPDQCKAELNDMLEDCLRIVKDLKLQYRILDLCTGDMGDKYARCYDIEVYSPALKKWLEVSSVGHFSDYQARRANIKFIDADGKRKVAYTLNGSGMATPRIIAAILETYQLPNGSVAVPDVLKPFMGCKTL